MMVRPRLTIAEAADQERAQRLLEKAERACLISRSLSSHMELQATVEVGAAVPVESPGEVEVSRSVK